MKLILQGLWKIVFGILAVAAFCCQKPEHQTFPVQQVAQLLHDDSSVVLLDVRAEKEYKSETGHLKGAILLPVRELENRLSELEPYKHRTIVAYCRTGNRSGKAAQLLTEKGFTAINMAGGIIEWNKQNLPVTKEP